MVSQLYNLGPYTQVGVREMNAYVFISELPITGAAKTTDARTIAAVPQDSRAIGIRKFTGARHRSWEHELDIPILEPHRPD